MFCVHCGSYLKSETEACSACGKAPDRIVHASVGGSGAAVAMAASSPAAMQTFDPSLQQLRLQHPELVGVGGWLGWFCIVTVILSPAFIVMGVASEPSAYSVLDVALGAFSIVTGLAIWRLSSRALKFTKILLGIQFAIGVLLVLAQIVDSSASSASSKPDVGGARMLVASIFWFSYFKRSRRVRATFGRNI